MNLSLFHIRLKVGIDHQIGSTAEFPSFEFAFDIK